MKQQPQARHSVGRSEAFQGVTRHLVALFIVGSFEAVKHSHCNPTKDGALVRRFFSAFG
jgi:hypothetical protein